MIVKGVLQDGDSLGSEPELIDRFGVSRPSLREAMRILETEGLIEVVRGHQGGVVVHGPGRRETARTAAIVLQARNVSLADVFEAKAMLEPLAVGAIVASRRRKSAVKELRSLIERQRQVLGDPVAFAVANAWFHERLVACSGNQTLTIVAEMLNEVVARAVSSGSRGKGPSGSQATRRRCIRSQERLLELIKDSSVLAAEDHWRTHMATVSRIMLRQDAKTIIDFLHHDDR
jgi:DNA-binding FadR family transcriptional regulator